LAAIISVLCVANAKASPVTYTESATVSGSLNGVSFTSQLFTITGTGDTTGISGITNHFVTATFSVTGVGNGSFGVLAVFDNPSTNPAAAGFTDEGFGADILDTFNAAFASYDLRTSIGPITGPSFITKDSSLLTALTGEHLSFTSAGDATFTAIVTPLPAALPLFASGLVGLGLLGWRRKRAAAG
jgi:hypothetical protein